MKKKDLVVLADPKTKKRFDKETKQDKNIEESEDYKVYSKEMPGPWNCYRFVAQKEVIDDIANFFTQDKLHASRKYLILDEEGFIA